MAELKTREDKHSPIVRMNQLEIVLSKLSNEQQNQVSMIGRGISNFKDRRHKQGTLCSRNDRSDGKDIIFKEIK